MIRHLVDTVFAHVKREAVVAIERTHLYSHSVRDRVALVDVPRDVEIRRIEAGEMSEMGALGVVEAQEWVDRLRRGDQCYGAWVSGELGHYSWIQRSGKHRIGSAGRTATVQPGTFWIYNCRTGERWRGMRLYPRTLSVILADYFAAGLSKAWIYTTHQNVASQRGILRAGFTAIEEFRALRLGRWTWSMRTRSAATTSPCARSTMEIDSVSRHSFRTTHYEMLPRDGSKVAT